MEDRIALITGSTGGIGKETARGLARLGAHIVLVGRDQDRAAAAADELRRDTGNDAVDALTADVTRQADLHRLADEVGARYGRLHVLVNNAAIVRGRRELTADGVEAMFAANVLARSCSPTCCCRPCAPPRRGGLSTSPARSPAAGSTSTTSRASGATPASSTRRSACSWR
jgi:NAD(P)-dependent dehydrogenase (short-subunit alcohol dehydrogenase family)